MVVFPWFLSLAVAAQVDVGADRAEEIEAAVDRAATLVVESRRDVVLLPENHKDSIAKSFYSAVIERVAHRSGKRVCNFLELGEAYQSRLNGLSRLGSDGVRCFEIGHEILSRDFVEVFGRKPHHWMHLVELAGLAQAGVRNLAVDENLRRDDFVMLRDLVDDPTLSESERLRLMDERLIRARNEHMSRRIRELFRSERCEIGFFGAGVAHVYPPHASMPGVGQRLAPELSTLAIHAQGCRGPPCPFSGSADLQVRIRE